MPRSYAPLQKSRQNHRSHVGTDAWHGFRAGAKAIRYSVNIPKSGAMTFISGKIHLFNVKVSERI